jgi:hypothetical protein
MLSATEAEALRVCDLLLLLLPRAWSASPAVPPAEESREEREAKATESGSASVPDARFSFI